MMSENDVAAPVESQGYFPQRDDFKTWLTHQQDLVKQALANKHVCLHCEVRGCDRKCSGCRSVTYCSKQCQVADWKKHKVICRTLLQITDEIALREQSKCGLNGSIHMFCEVLCCSLLLLGIEDAQVVFISALCHFDIELDDLGTCLYTTMPTVYANGRLYNPCHNRYRNKFKQVSVYPLPDSIENIHAGNLPQLDKKITTYPLALPESWQINGQCETLEQYLREHYTVCTGKPWLAPNNIDQNDLMNVQKFLCRHSLERVCLEKGVDRTMRLLGDEVIHKATGESRQEFKKRMDSYKLEGFEEESFNKLAYMKFMDECYSALDVKYETRVKFAPSLESFRQTFIFHV